MTPTSLKILLFTNSHLPRIGGKEIVVHHLAQQFTNMGHNVRVAGPAGIWRNRKVKLGYRVDRSPSYFWMDREAQWHHRTNRILRKHSFDIIHAHATHPCGYYAQKYLQSHKLNTPLVVTPHGADIHKVPEINFGRRLDPALDEKIKWLLSVCDQSTAISDSVRDSLLEANAREDHISMIRNGVDTARFAKPAGFSAHDRLGIPSETPLFISVGNYHPRKGHEKLIDAVAALPNTDLHLAIVGRTNVECMAHVKNLELDNKITFTGAITYPGVQNDEDLLAAMLQQGRGYVSASMGEGTEGLSLALLEAMSAGLCPLATNISGNRDIVVDGVSGYLVEPGSTEALAEKLQYLSESPDVATKLGETAQTSVAHMSWSAIAEQYLQLYRSLIEAGR